MQIFLDILLKLIITVLWRTLVFIDGVFGESRHREGFWQFKPGSFAPEGLNVRFIDS